MVFGAGPQSRLSSTGVLEAPQQHEIILDASYCFAPGMKMDRSSRAESATAYPAGGVVVGLASKVSVTAAVARHDGSIAASAVGVQVTHVGPHHLQTGQSSSIPLPRHMTILAPEGGSCCFLCGEEGNQLIWIMMTTGNSSAHRIMLRQWLQPVILLVYHESVASTLTPLPFTD